MRNIDALTSLELLESIWPGFEFLVWFCLRWGGNVHVAFGEDAPRQNWWTVLNEANTQMYLLMSEPSFPVYRPKNLTPEKKKLSQKCNFSLSRSLL